MSPSHSDVSDDSRDFSNIHILQYIYKDMGSLQLLSADRYKESFLEERPGVVMSPGRHTVAGLTVIGLDGARYLQH